MNEDPKFDLEPFSEVEKRELLPFLENGLQTLFLSVDGARTVNELHRQGIKVA